jgi:hypothetical protein
VGFLSLPHDARRRKSLCAFTATTPPWQTIAFFLFGLSSCGFAQNSTVERSKTSGYHAGYNLNDDLRRSAQGHYPGSPVGSPFAPAETNFDQVFDTVRREQEKSATYQEIAERQRLRAAQEEAARSREALCCMQRSEALPQANPDAPDQSELLRNSKDRDFTCTISAPYMWTRAMPAILAAIS